MQTPAKKVLIVDDHEDILEVVSEVLSYQGFDIKTISDGHQLTNHLYTFQPDLVIMDYRLGDENGGELCQQIKANAAFAQTPVILYSAYLPATADVSKYQCDDMLTKPFDMDEILVRINKLLK